MKNRISQWVSRGALATMALLAVSACTDDHFDIKNTMGSDKTLWETIESNPNLSDFAGILKRTKVLSNENDHKATITAAELLNQPQSFTMWAPVNGSFNAKAWNDTLDAAAKYAALGTAEGRTKALDISYYVWSQLVGNHIARFNHEGYTGKQEIKMMNEKNAIYSGDKFDNVPVQGSTEVASNGSLHLLNGVAPFAYNIFDYLGYYPQFSSVNNLIASRTEIDTLWNSSTPGALNEKGQMVYVDTVVIRRNEILGVARASIREEDSTYVALIPTNEAWEQGKEKIGRILKYGARYSYEWNGADFNRKVLKDQFRLDAATKADPKLTLADSLQQRITEQNMAVNMFFAPYYMRNIDAKDSAQLNNYVQHADSLISTAGTVFYNAAADGSGKNSTLNPIFAGLTPYRASNGYIYRLTKYDLDPAYAWVKKVEYLMSRSGFYTILNTNNVRSASGKGTFVALNESNYNEYRAKTDEEGKEVTDAEGNVVMTGVKGDISTNSYVRFQIDNIQSEMVVNLRLPQVFSTRYEVELVMVPSKTDLNFGDVDDERVIFTAKVVDDEGKELEFIDEDGNATKSITIDQEEKDAKGNPQFDQSKVNTIKLGKYIDFPKCYAGLPSGIDSFPRLVLTMPKKKRSDKKIRCSALNIVSLVLKPYRGN
jgi:lipoprotein